MEGEGPENDRVISVTEEDIQSFKRLDQFLASKCEDLSRTFLKGLFLKEMISLSEASSYQGKVELKKMPPAGTIINISVPPPLPSNAIAENIPLEILFEDQHLVIVNKPPGLVTHPAPGHPNGTLVNAILHHCPDLKGVGDQKRPGIVHRLDKGTSGVMVVAKDQKTHERLVLLFSTHDIQRKYIALTLGKKMPPSGKLESTIGRHPQNRLKMAINVRKGKSALTYYKVKEFYDQGTLLEMTLETGRTHQIRVHLSELLRSPILMDPLYGHPKDHLKRLSPALAAHLKEYPHPLLHAEILGFKHPITGEDLFFQKGPPDLFLKTIELFKEN
jgi:23S rRNA pseudouridine1911/1915/1917 synthase